LVGALSIIRFRTAIKEPEELGYFFIAICIGLGMGASQLLPTLIGFLILVVVIIVLSNKKLNSSLTQNLVISTTCNQEKRSTIVGEISAIIEENSKQVELKRLNHSESNVDLNFLVHVSNLESIQAISRELFGIDNKMTITFMDNEI